MAKSGIRLQLLIGPTLPKPAPIEVMDSLIDLEVTTQDRELDGLSNDLQHRQKEKAV